MSSAPYNQQNTNPIDLDLGEILEQHKKNTLLNFNCHHVGTIQAFNASNQTATVSVNYLKTFYKLNTTTNTYDSVPVPYPVLVQCPVIFLGGGLTHLTFPVSQGDECLILFNDRDLDNWFVNGAGSEVNSSRLHSFSDGIILVGLRSSKNVISGFDSTRAVISDGNAKCGINPTNHKVTIQNNTQTLNNAIQDLIKAIKGLTFGGSRCDNPSSLNGPAGEISGVIE